MHRRKAQEAANEFKRTPQTNALCPSALWPPSPAPGPGLKVEGVGVWREVQRVY